MKIVGTGSTYRVYADDLQTFDKLPIGVYKVSFSEFTGFYLEKQQLAPITEKLYGHHMEKVEKILRSFNKFDRNLGVIFSGDKGIGKSLAAKLLSEASIKANLPVILVTQYFQGVAGFLNEITQEAVIIFDEFDKTFVGGRNTNNGNKGDSQSELLSLLDGFNGLGKKLYVVTCNELYNLNDFLVNRPGRFHYHIVFSYPTDDEIREYLHDKLDSKYYGEIENVVKFAGRVDINYDCLRAIAFELNNGLSFNDAISDLNIINYRRGYEHYTAFLILEDGTRIFCKRYNLDCTSSYEDEIVFDDGKLRVSGSFTPAEDLQYSLERGGEILSGEKLTDVQFWKYIKNENGESSLEELDEIDFPKIKEIIFKRVVERHNIHYAV